MYASAKKKLKGAHCYICVIALLAMISLLSPLLAWNWKFLSSHSDSAWHTNVCRAGGTLAAKSSKLPKDADLIFF